MKKQLSRFLLIGGIATIISYLTFLIALKIFHIHYLISNVIAFATGILFGYPLNKKWTFKRDKKTSHFYGYLAVYLVSLLISTVFLRITVEGIGVPAEIANILAIGITTCTNFLGIKFFVFGRS